MGLGLGEVLLNTKTGQYFTPNTKTVTDLNGTSRVVDGAEGVGGNGKAAAPPGEGGKRGVGDAAPYNEGLKGGEGK